MDEKVVADTNIFVSGLLWTGPSHKIIKLAGNKYITLYSSIPIVDELLGVLLRDKFIPRIEKLNTTTEELVESLLSVTQIVHPSYRVSAVVDDPDDNKILECAMAAQVDYIVTGDPHLLRLRDFEGIPIILPQQFLKQIS